MWKKITLLALVATSVACADNYMDGLDMLRDAQPHAERAKEVIIREQGANSLETTIWMLQQDRFPEAAMMCDDLHYRISKINHDKRDVEAQQLLEKIKKAENIFKQGFSGSTKETFPW